MKKNTAIKTALNILLLLGFAAITGPSFAQQKDFSDWNVPPPVPPGSMAKGGTPPKATIAAPVIDVPHFALPKIAAVKISKLDPVLTTAPKVVIPGQPAFPATPFLVDAIPLPEIPEALSLPNKVPQDKAGTDFADLPEPEAPDMPDMPKSPDAITGKFSGVPAKIPATPLLPTQVVPFISTDFPFTEWPLPPIPVNPPFKFTFRNSSDDVSSKPKIIQKVKKAPRRNK